MAGDVRLDLVAEAPRAAKACVGVVEHGADAARVERAGQSRVAVLHCAAVPLVASARNTRDFTCGEATQVHGSQLSRRSMDHNCPPVGRKSFLDQEVEDDATYIALVAAGLHIRPYDPLDSS